MIYEKWGEQAVKNQIASCLGEIAGAESRATITGANLGIPIQSGISLPKEIDGNVIGSPAVAGGLTVASFNFSSDGSTYAVTTNTSGQLVGTKDGQAWETWGVPANTIPSTTDELAALLASFNAKDAAANSAAQTASTAVTASSAPTVQPVTISANIDQVSTALDFASQVQILKFEYNHANWNELYQEIGEQGVKNVQAGLIGEINSSNITATAMGSRFGIPIQSNLTLPTESNGSVSGSPIISGGVTVAPFNFSSGGSTYAVTTNAAGQLVGTKNGQAWETWGVPANTIPSTTDELVALLASFNAKDAAANGSARTASTAAAASSAPTVQPVTISATSDQVSTTLETVSGVNSDIWFYNHTDWNAIYKAAGEQAIKSLQKSFSSEISHAIGLANAAAGSVGVPVISDITVLTNQSSGNNATASAQIIMGGLTVAPFNFSCGGSTYAVTTNTAGQIVGTKDGQAWQTWGVPANTIPSTADELLALLASFNAKDAASNSAAQTANSVPAKVDVFA